MANLSVDPRAALSPLAAERTRNDEHLATCPPGSDASTLLATEPASAEAESPDGLGADVDAATAPSTGAASEVGVRLGASPLRCPFCHASIRPVAEDWVACRSCLARHHAGCWHECGKCANCASSERLVTRAAPRTDAAPRRSGASPIVLAAVFLGGGTLAALVQSARFRVAQDIAIVERDTLVAAAVDAERERAARDAAENASRLAAERAAAAEHERTEQAARVQAAELARRATETAEAQRVAAERANAELELENKRQGLQGEIDARIADASSSGVDFAPPSDLGGKLARLDAALASDPKWVPLWRGRGALKITRGDLEGAIADLSTALELGGADSTTLGLRGLAWFQKGKLELAIADTTTALALDPLAALALEVRAAARLDTGDSTRAIEDATRLIGRGGTPWAFTTRARAECVTKDWKAAIEDSTRALTGGFHFVPAYAVRGEARAATGDLAAAIEDLDVFLARDRTGPGRAAAWARVRALRRERRGGVASVEPIPLEPGTGPEPLSCPTQIGARTFFLQGKNVIEAVVGSGGVVCASLPTAPVDMAGVGSWLVVACPETKSIALIEASTGVSRATVALPEAPFAIGRDSPPGKVAVLCREQKKRGPRGPSRLVEIDLADHGVRELLQTKAVSAAFTGDWVVLQDDFENQVTFARLSELRAGTAQTYRPNDRTDWFRGFGRWRVVNGGLNFVGTDASCTTELFSAAGLSQLWMTKGTLLAVHPTEPLAVVLSNFEDNFVHEWTLHGISTLTGEVVWKQVVEFEQAVRFQEDTSHRHWSSRCLGPPALLVATKDGDQILVATTETTDLTPRWVRIPLPATRAPRVPTYLGGALPTRVVVGASFALVPEIGGADAETRYALEAGPEGMTIDAATGRLSWLPDEAAVGERDVSVVAQRAGASFPLFKLKLVVVRGSTDKK